MNKVDVLEKEIAEIKKRNKRVEADKAWETSLTRRVFVAVSTYVLIALFMLIINIERPFMSALIPTVGYLLSTISLGIAKDYWLKNRK